MDHLTVGLNSVPQSVVVVRRLQLRQLRATLSKGQTSRSGVFQMCSFLPLRCRLTVWPVCVCRSVVQVWGAVLRPEPGPAVHGDDHTLPVCAQHGRRPAGVE